MITILQDDADQRLVQFDTKEECAEAMEIVVKGFANGEFHKVPIFFTYLPPKTLDDLAKIDIYPQAGYIGIRTASIYPGNVSLVNGRDRYHEG